MRILITGGLGFIGSQVAVSAISDGHEVVILDDESTGRATAVERIRRVTGIAPQRVTRDVRSPDALDAVLEQGIDTVIHCAGAKSVGDSVHTPLKYYDINVGGTMRLLERMAANGVNRLVFSSSATVYGAPERLPLTEDSMVGFGLTNPYGRTKYIAELLLQDAANAHPELEITLLRYFNPIGAHESGLIGEDPSSRPTNVFPLIAEAAVGARDHVVVFGDDYATPDGTGVRDYIHVTDLADGHLAAVAGLRPGVQTFNLGTGRGTSVLELIHEYERASGNPIEYIIGERRQGDVASCYADAAKAATELGWTARRTVADACEDSWKWQKTLHG
ncbi:UDP-glucose 4-epimerase GalE [Agromyces italicus]|uniref:UDP-glucose 4-epimerase GalE n=1 Tax=Agromyces italicus TaxID=279572 RepID=UPI0003B6FE5D|nr:UDP-glucose 4-epimerase GalE [Agromyces italicus]